MNGWKWVPVEPTPRMLAAGVAAEANAPTHVQERLTLLAYRAMLAAAPPPAADAVTGAMVRAAERAHDDMRGNDPGFCRKAVPAMIAAALAARGK